MKEYKGKKVEPREIDEIELKLCPNDFQGGKYIGFCNLEGLPHGLGELISADKEKPMTCNGEWEDGVFLKGTYNQPYLSRYEGSFNYDDTIGSGDWELHGEGIELYYGTEQNYNNNKVIGHVKGIFENGKLLVGEILNPSLIEYSEYEGIKKIIYEKSNVRKVFDEQLKSNIYLKFGEIIYEDGSHYKGELDFDLPYGNGTMTLLDGNSKTCEWYNGNTIEEK